MKNNNMMSFSKNVELFFTASWCVGSMHTRVYCCTIISSRTIRASEPVGQLYVQSSRTVTRYRLAIHIVKLDVELLQWTTIVCAVFNSDITEWIGVNVGCRSHWNKTNRIFFGKNIDSWCDIVTAVSNQPIHFRIEKKIRSGSHINPS